MKETCVICGAETPFDVETHIDFRYYYIEGAGQLCRKCYTGEEKIPHIENFVPFKECMMIPIDIIENTPNDAELGATIRQLYWDYKK